MGNKRICNEPLGRLECTTGGSNKYWECLEDVDGTYLTRWGKIGAKLGANSMKKGLNQHEASRKISEKLGKGYRHIACSACSVKEFAENDAASLEAAMNEILAAPTEMPVAPVRERPRL